MLSSLAKANRRSAGVFPAHSLPHWVVAYKRIIMMQKCDGNLVAVSLSLHPFDGLIVLSAVVLLVIEGEGFLALVGGLLVCLLLLVHQWKIDQLSEALVAVEEALVAFAA